MFNGSREAGHHQLFFLFLIHRSLFKFQGLRQLLKVLDIIIINWHDVNIEECAIFTSNVPEQKELFLVCIFHELKQWILKLGLTDLHLLTQNVPIAISDVCVNIFHCINITLWRIVVPAWLEIHEVLRLVAFRYGDDLFWVIQRRVTHPFRHRANTIYDHD